MTSNFIQPAKVLIKKVIHRLERTYGKLVGAARNRLESPQTEFVAPQNLADLAPYVNVMAQTGQGTDACLELGCLPVLVHYYSPIPDIKDLDKRDIWNKTSSLPGIDFCPNEQIKLLMELGRRFGSECDWPLNKTPNPYQFYLKNNSFSFGCAASLHCMVRYWKPRHIVEVGSGNSSMVISAAIKSNLKENTNLEVDYTIIDPYPDEIQLSGLPYLIHIEKQRVELVDPSFFSKLQENDMLFIDSSHSVKIGSDVNYLILEILPNIAPGVVIHFHDIPMPYEYSKAYAASPTFRMFWTESYLLQAFLSYNSKFEVLLGMAYLMQEHMDHFCRSFPNFKIKDNWANSGSFWIRRVTSS
jgi:hypothetical protein